MRKVWQTIQDIVLFVPALLVISAMVVTIWVTDIFKKHQPPKQGRL